MRRYLRKLGGLSSAFILIGTLGGCATHRECGLVGCSGDAKLSTDVRTLFDQHPELGAPNLIDVRTVDHVVYLNGTVSEGMQRREAEAVALQARGVTRVVNLIAVSR
jgi:osmotically-inducible protein OsmY